jgi:hypothetical protein
MSSSKVPSSTFWQKKKSPCAVNKIMDVHVVYTSSCEMDGWMDGCGGGGDQESKIDDFD